MVLLGSCSAFPLRYVVSGYKGDFCCLERLLDSVVEYVHGLLPINYWLHAHLRVEICSCWTGGGKSSHFSIPQPMPWNSPQLPASNNCHFSSLGASDCIYAWTTLRCCDISTVSRAEAAVAVRGHSSKMHQTIAHFRETQAGWGWKGLWEVLWSKFPAQAEPVTWG